MFIKTLVWTFATSLIALTAAAETRTLEVTIGYRERIALPPGAQVEVRLLDLSRRDPSPNLIAAQRALLSGVPMTVDLPYDPQVIENRSDYAISATIWSADRALFKTTKAHPVLTGESDSGVDLMLSMVTETPLEMTAPISIDGIEWVVTEIAGVPLQTDTPATMVIDDEMNAAIFAGCNRFVGKLTVSGSEIVFPENLAGTLMACPPEAGALEDDFLTALRGASRYVRYGSGLVLMDTEGRALLHFIMRTE